MTCGWATGWTWWFRLPGNAEFSSSFSDLHVSFCSHFSAHARKSEHRPFDLVRQLRVELLPRYDVFWSCRTCLSSSSSRMSGFYLMQWTMQRWFYLDKSRLHLMQNGGGIAVEFFTTHVRKFARCTFHLVGQYIVSSIYLKAIANWVYLFIAKKSTPSPTSYNKKRYFFMWVEFTWSVVLQTAAASTMASCMKQ